MFSNNYIVYAILPFSTGDADKIKLAADAEAYHIKTVAEAQRESIDDGCHCS